ncbi:MAG: hypothetical protein ACOYM3_28585 [Terrimicrobiaceae bacterium]
MFALKRLLILGLILIAVYIFWPRSPNLTDFDPQRMSELQVAIWKGSAEKPAPKLILPLYELYERQYHLPPISSLKMALDTDRALHLFHSAPDAADQEKALLPLQTSFSTLKSNTKATFDPNIAARMELMIWILRADHAKRAQLMSAWSEQIALFYGRSASECLPAARNFAIAARFADEANWRAAQASSLEAWTAIKELSPPGK